MAEKDRQPKRDILTTELRRLYGCLSRNHTNSIRALEGFEWKKDNLTDLPDKTGIKIPNSEAENSNNA